MFSSPEFLDFTRRALDRVHTVSQIGFVIRQMAHEASLTHIVYHLGIIPGRPEADAVTLLTYSSDWVNHYLNKKYQVVDPVVSVADHGILPTDWSSFTRLSQKTRTLFGEAREHGVGSNGMTIPLRGRFGEKALFSFTSDETEKEWIEMKRQILPSLHVASYLVHQRVLDLAAKPEVRSPPQLSPRELDCLKYLAIGLRDQQIGETLGISTKTVTVYIESMRHKIGAATRTHAISLGIKLAIIPTDIG